MKKNEIKVGGLYRAKVNDKIVTVRVDKIFDTVQIGSKGAYGKGYEVTNLETGKKTTFRSAAKFREEVMVAKKVKSMVKETDGYQILNDADKAAYDKEIEKQQKEDQKRTQGRIGLNSTALPAPTEGKKKADPPKARGKAVPSAVTMDVGTPALVSNGKESKLVPTVKSAVAAPPTSVTASESATAALDRLGKDNGDNAPHLIVEARAGTGKTFTLIVGVVNMFRDLLVEDNDD